MIPTIIVGALTILILLNRLRSFLKPKPIPGWVSMHQQMPKIGETVFFKSSPNGRVLRGFRIDDDGTFADDVSWGEHDGVKYWRLL